VITDVLYLSEYLRPNYLCLLCDVFRVVINVRIWTNV